VAFPTVSDAATTAVATNDATPTANYPATVASDDLLILFTSNDGSGDSPSYSAPMTLIVAEAGDAGGCGDGAAYEFAAGDEDGGTVDWTISGAEESVCRILAIAGAHATTPPEGALSGSEKTDTSPDSPSVSPSWGAEDNMFIAFYAQNNGGAATAYPTSYADNQVTAFSSAASGNCSMGLATRELNATSDDPAVFTSDTSAAWAALTVVVRPAAGVAATPHGVFGHPLHGPFAGPVG